MFRAGQWILDAFFPPRCVACTEPIRSEGFCPPCGESVTFIQPPVCTICGLPFTAPGADHACSGCLDRAPHFDRARSCARYDRPTGAPSALALALHRYKYGGEVTLAPFLGQILSQRCPFPIDHDLVLPVPLHRQRLRRRGFNQSLLLARPLARRYRVPLDPLIFARCRETPPQVGLPEEERRRNIAGAFSVRRPQAVRDRSILLVDDVYTTGATVNECARTLRAAGARRVDVLVLARVAAG